MPYCLECGTIYEERNLICVSCGRNLNEDPRQSQAEINTEQPSMHKNDGGERSGPVVYLQPGGSGEMKEAFTSMAQEPLGQRVQEFTGGAEASDQFDFEKTCLRLASIESQLGKGIIKPKSVEVGMDGIHFKYDDPPRNFVKVEPCKEKVVEYRVTAPDLEPQAKQVPERTVFAEASETFHATGEQPAEVTEPLPEEAERLQEEGELTLKNMEQTSGEMEPEGVTPKPELEETARVEVGEMVSEQTLLTSESSLPLDLTPEEVEPVAGPVVEEVSQETMEPYPPRIAALEQRVVVWEGRQTWLRIPLSKMYRLTNQTLVVDDLRDYKLMEVDLSLITGVEMKQSWLGKMLGIGDLLVLVRNSPDPRFRLVGVTNPLKVKEMLEKMLGSKV